MPGLARLRLLVERRPAVVAAMQSPHLLNIWKQSRVWRLFYDLLGDHDGLEEVKDTQINHIDTSGVPPKRVRAVLVATPSQMENAHQKYPYAKIFWVVHTGYFLEVFPTEHIPQVDGIITLTRSVMDIQLAHKPAMKTRNNHVITPFYIPNPIWRWKEGTLWTIRSRASSRMAPSKDRFERVMNGIKKALVKKERVLFFGSGAPDGYIDAKGKEKLFKQSSGYISALPEDAGFGLAEHEAMAHGVPIIGSRWGDIDEEVSRAYSALSSSETDMVDAALKVSRDKSYAEKMSELGLEYIRSHRTKRQMDAQIRRFVRALKASG